MVSSSRDQARGAFFESRQADNDPPHPSRRAILPFPARLRASHAKLGLRSPSPPAVPYTMPTAIGNDCRDEIDCSRGDVDDRHVSVGIPAYRLDSGDPLVDDNRGGDELGGGGKKRKVPTLSFSASLESDLAASFPAVHEPVTSSFVTRHHTPSLIARSHLFHKLLFARRKSQILTLQNDAFDLIKASLSKAKSTGSPSKAGDKVPGPEELQPLWKGLENVPVGKWPWDRMAWRGKAVVDDPLVSMPATDSNVVATSKPRKPVVGRWASATWRKRRYRLVPRPRRQGTTGWIPEGSFELEITTSASAVPRKNQQLLSQLRRYVQDLLTVSLGPSPSAATTRATKKASKVPSAATVASAPPATTTTPAPARVSASPDKSPVSDATEFVDGSLDGATAGKPKKKGKKKRSALANNSNPHHVKNYVPSRVAAPTSAPDPTMSSVLSSLLFPMPTRFLSARPSNITSAVGSALPGPTGSDEFICASCEYSLFFGGRESMRKAIAKRKKELKRRERVLRRARGVTEGRKPGTSAPYYGNDDEDDWCDEEDNECTCGGIAGNNDASERAHKGRIKDDVH